MRVLLLACLLTVAASVSAGGQSPKAAPPNANPAGKVAIPRTPDGRPDLHGTWDFAQLTPFERPTEFTGKSTLTGQEAEGFARQRIETNNKDRRDGGAKADVERAYNDFWWDFGTRVATQTSLVVDPPDGRLPPLTPAAKERAAARPTGFDNPEDLPLRERCIIGFNSGPPMVPSAYNNNMQIVQTRDYVLIFNEMIHSARVVDMNRRSHYPASMRFLTGDSIGRWEGETLVVDTTNFLKDGAFRDSTANMHLIERFTRTDAKTLRYDFTVNDLATWTRPWTASIPMIRTDDRIFEYACHEANYSLEGTLKGARLNDKLQSTK
jgi:hypothetical protein